MFGGALLLKAEIKLPKKNLEMLSSEMTQQQIAQAQKEAAELWKRINKSKK